MNVPQQRVLGATGTASAPNLGLTRTLLCLSDRTTAGGKDPAAHSPQSPSLVGGGEGGGVWRRTGSGVGQGGHSWAGLSASGPCRHHLCVQICVIASQINMSSSPPSSSPPGRTGRLRPCESPCRRRLQGPGGCSRDWGCT